MGAHKAAGKMHERGPERIAWGGMCNRDRRGPVPTSEITLSGSGRCSGRGRARGGITHRRDCARVLGSEGPKGAMCTSGLAASGTLYDLYGL